jgi:hypothetical protein
MPRDLWLKTRMNSGCEESVNKTFQHSTFHESVKTRMNKDFVGLSQSLDIGSA